MLNYVLDSNENADSDDEAAEDCCDDTKIGLDTGEIVSDGEVCGSEVEIDELNDLASEIEDEDDDVDADKENEDPTANSNGKRTSIYFLFTNTTSF